MRKQHNVKPTGFTYTTPATLLEITEQGVTRVPPPVAHVDVRPNAVIGRDLIDMVRDITGATPVFHRWHRITELPTALGINGDRFAS
jgi:hypothetical protein